MLRYAVLRVTNDGLERQLNEINMLKVVVCATCAVRYSMLSEKRRNFGVKSSQQSRHHYARTSYFEPLSNLRSSLGAGMCHMV